MNVLLERLKDQWRENPRLRLGILLILLIVTFPAIDWLDSQRLLLGEDSQRQQKKRQHITAISNQGDWAERAEQARAARVEWEVQLWRADTPGLARADLQSWFNRKLHGLKLDQLQVQVEQAKPLPGLDGVWAVGSQIKGSLSAAQLVQLLQRLELNPQPIRVAELRIRRRKGRLRLEMTISAYYLIASQGQQSS